MFGQLWTEIRLQVAWALCAGTRVCVYVHVCVYCLVAISPVSLQDTELLDSYSTLYSMCKCVSFTAALWGWAIGTMPLHRWLGNPV